MSLPTIFRPCGPWPASALIMAFPALPAQDASSSTTPDPRSSDLWSRQVGQANLRLIELSADLLFAIGGSSEDDESLQSLQGGGHDPRKRGFTLQQLEISLTGAVDPYFNAEAHIIYVIEPLEGESIVELEEAFFTTQLLPFDLQDLGLQFEVGQSFTEFGRLNPLHPHSWDFVDLPVVNARFFGPDGMRAPGARMDWLTPLPWFAQLSLGVQNANGETMASFFANDEFFAERPVAGRPFVEGEVRGLEDLVYLARVENGFDLGDELSMKVGASFLTGPNATGPDGTTMVYGGDAVLKWRPLESRRGWPFVIVQAEVMGREYRADDFSDPNVTLSGRTFEDWGFYAQVLYGFAVDWVAGVRVDVAGGDGETGPAARREDDPFRADRRRVSPLLVWHPTEFSRVRLQYNYDRADHLDSNEAHSVWLGFEVLFGQHPTHAY